MSRHCELTDLPADWCAHCRDAERQAPTRDEVADFLFSDPPRTEATIQARWPGRCADCGEYIAEGDDITSSPDGWVCEGCA